LAAAGVVTEVVRTCFGHADHAERERLQKLANLIVGCGRKWEGMDGASE